MAAGAAVLALTATSIGAAPAPKTLLDRPTPGTIDQVSDGEIRHVANIPYSGGSDLEFVRRKIDVGASKVWRDYVVLGRLAQAVRIVDITNPEEPNQVAVVPCRLNQNDIQIQGSILVMAADSTTSCTFPGQGSVSFKGFATADISDPRNPVVLGRANISQGAHNLTVHPTEPIVYVSNSDLVGIGVVHVWDISNPAAPQKVTDWTFHGMHSPHDITFNADGTRAFAASISHVDIFDTTDARRPALMRTIVDPAINIAHQADPTPDDRFLIVSDELAGAATGVSCPGGGLHVYDISNPAEAPVKVGVFWADDVGRNGVCTSHVFRINPDGHTMAIAWYNAGVHVIDFEDLLKAGAAGSHGLIGVGTRTIARLKMPNADTWSAKMWQRRHPGYVFANDMGRGFDVFFVPSMA